MIVEPLTMLVNAEDYSEATEPRSPGLHLGRIIGALDQARGTKYPESSEQTKQTYFSMGFMWETFLSNIFLDTAIKKAAGVLVRPGELVSDGIAMSPDALDLSDYVLEEYKATWRSSIHPIDDKRFWAWIVQMKCYCRALGTYRARLRVFFVNGDWRSSGPQVRAWSFQFTPRELEETWAMCLNHARAENWI